MEYYQQPFNSTVPELVKVSNWPENFGTDISQIEVDVSKIESNTSQVHNDGGALVDSESTLHDRIIDTNLHLESLEEEIGKQSDAAGSNTISGQIKQISAATGHSTDTADENSVIGLLKSIINKLS